MNRETPQPTDRSPASAASYSVTAGRELALLEQLSVVFRQWLTGHPLLGSAAQEWRRYLGMNGAAPPRTAGAGNGVAAAATALATASYAANPAAAWATDSWREPWLRELLADLPDDAARQRAEANVEQLAAGRAEVVITGQQPGFLGGPLYTLYKAAAAVAAAEARSRAGQPTVPLFWMADDDDDRQEAFQARLYDQQRRTFLQAVPPDGAADHMVGAAPAAVWGRGEAAWLAELSERHELARDLARLWREAAGHGLTWGRLQRRALLRLFRKTDLLCVSGNDGRLHDAAADFYGRWWTNREQLTAAVQERGAELAAAGFPAQIGEASLVRLLNLAEGGRRLAWVAEGAGQLPSAARLRPGVALRSLVQDWLFQPAGVVIGPGELAYLRQLDRAYGLLGLRRSPLLPRLFAWIVPSGGEDSSPGGWLARGEERAGDTAGVAAAVSDHDAKTTADKDASDADLLPATADRVVAAAAAVLAAALVEEAGAAAARARQLARRLTARWRPSVAQLIERERTRQHRDRAGPGTVPWLAPGGRRQERSLATHWATAWWGDPLVAAVLQAAARHCQSGAGVPWREYHLHVPEI